MKMTQGKPLTAVDRSIIDKDIAEGVTQQAVIRELGRRVRTVQHYLNNPLPRRTRTTDKGVSKSLTARDRRRFEYNLRRKLGKTSERIFEDSGLLDVPKTSRNQILKTLGKFRTLELNPLLSPKHKEMSVKWVRTYMKLNMMHVLFTDESRASLDGPHSLGKG